ncbi:hypothetical protein BDV12DRAFT_163571 [Aspergillus spectabilis]
MGTPWLRILVWWTRHAEWRVGDTPAIRSRSRLCLAYHLCWSGTRAADFVLLQLRYRRLSQMHSPSSPSSSPLAISRESKVKVETHRNRAIAKLHSAPQYGVPALCGPLYRLLAL